MSKEKIDFGQVIYDFDGTAVSAGLTLNKLLQAIAKVKLPEESIKLLNAAIDEVSKEPMTLCEAALLGLRNVPEDERASLSAKAREDRFRLALRVNKNGMVKISTAERDELKKVIGKVFPHDLLVTETCNMLLEGKKVEAEPEDESKE